MVSYYFFKAIPPKHIIEDVTMDPKAAEAWEIILEVAMAEERTLEAAVVVIEAEIEAVVVVITEITATRVLETIAAVTGAIEADTVVETDMAADIEVVVLGFPGETLATRLSIMDLLEMLPI